MKAVQTFTVVSKLPEPLGPLRDIAMNLGWIADDRAQDLFRRIDREQWDYVRDPAGMLALESSERLEELAEDRTFTSLAATVRDELGRSLEAPRWFQQHHDGVLRSVAYFSPEFGVAAGLPQYSGGLGVLAGDHLKAADALGLPLVGVGLFYHHGYFTQEVDTHGRQVERFPRLDPDAMALEAVPDVRISVDIAGTLVHARIWRASVGRIPLYLLDTDVEENADAERLITDRLYGGGQEERIRQEILLGIGGVRALEALAIEPQVFHINEGHAGFLALERIRRCIVEDHLTFPEATTAIRPGGVFTTHTPVPAGIDRFPRELMDRHFGSWCREVGLTLDELMELGHEPGEPQGDVFNMACMSLRLSGFTNGVSQLHGVVSRRMFAGIWPDVPESEVPIGAVTNGVHAPSWTAREMVDLFERVIGIDWQEASPERWEAITEVPDREMWAIRRTLRERLVAYLRHRLVRQGLRRGLSRSQVAWCDDALDPTVLTIGFARRFATYKRANLLLADLDRLRDLLTDADRPVQIVVAGKAHPADEAGKALLREVANTAADLGLRNRLVFVEDYDIAMARMLVAGVDVWLNNPLRPMEACGTSGMKAVYNGVLNCSVLDGWWDECYEPQVGWAIPSAEWEDDRDRRDHVEYLGMMHLLEHQVVPMFYDIDADGIPVDWVTRVKASIARLGPQVQATRMLTEYTEGYYEPAAARSESLRANGDEAAKALVRWKRTVFRAWPSVAVVSTEHQRANGEDTAAYRVEAQVTLGDLDPSDVDVQLLYGEVDPDDEIHRPTVASMSCEGPGDLPGRLRYGIDVGFESSGSFGYTVRVVPSHADVRTYAHLGRVAWAPQPGA
ncbi:MAG: alpha-glucan family phosphorylase [Acidimicrobiia bacterium]|nr:alpha-glucan family phosphorylase [Acidimicrobiia bacterium]